MGVSLYLTDSFQRYVDNFPTALAFALLLVFVIIFTQLQGVFVSSGTIFLDYGMLASNPLAAAALLFLAAVFLFFYSILVILIVFAVRRDLSRVKVHYYLTERVQKFAFKLFAFLAVLTIAIFTAFSLLVYAGLPALAINLVLFVLAVAFLFLPQAIVVDEEGLGSSINSNFEFMRKHPGAVLRVFAAGAAIMLALPLAEYAIDMVALVGNFVTLFVALVFVVPYLEILKTEFYMRKYDLVKYAHRKIPAPRRYH